MELQLQLQTNLSMGKLVKIRKDGEKLQLKSWMARYQRGSGQHIRCAFTFVWDLILALGDKVLQDWNWNFNSNIKNFLFYTFCLRLENVSHINFAIVWCPDMYCHDVLVSYRLKTRTVAKEPLGSSIDCRSDQAMTLVTTMRLGKNSELISHAQLVSKRKQATRTNLVANWSQQIHKNESRSKVFYI